MNQINRLFILTVLLSLTKFVMAQNGNPQTITLSTPGTINFQHLANQELLNPPVPRSNFNAEEDEEQHRGMPKQHDVTGATVTNVVLPTSGLRTQSPAPTTSFNGLTDNGQIIPPDVSGAAGPNHLLETINTQYRIFNKTGGTVSTLSLASFWSGVSGSPFCDPMSPMILIRASGTQLFFLLLPGVTQDFFSPFLKLMTLPEAGGNIQWMRRDLQDYLWIIQLLVLIITGS
jgi:hypothetical protein